MLKYCTHTTSTTWIHIVLPNLSPLSKSKFEIPLFENTLPKSLNLITLAILGTLRII